MRSPEARRIAILAGGGSLPGEIAASLIERGAHVHILAVAGAGEPIPLPCPQTTVDFGQVGKILRVLRDDALTELLVIGAVKRPDLTAIRLDWGAFQAVPAVLRMIRAGGDDGVLRTVIGFFERRGVRIIGPAEAAPELILPEGPFGRHAASPEQASEIARGLAIIAALAPFDVGQGVVVDKGRVVAIEGAEGTDRMLARVAALRGHGAANSAGVFVKCPKPGQELRIDLPAIGPNTVRGAVAAGLSGIAVAAGHVLAAEREELRALADSEQIFIEGVPADLKRRAPDSSRFAFEPLGRRQPRRQQEADAVKGAQVLTALEALDAGAGGVVVHRAHVLAVEIGEGVAATLERARGLRQWGRRVARRKTGVAVLARARELDEALAMAAAEAGVAGLAVMPGEGSPASEAAIAAANRRGLFVVALKREQGERG